MILTPDLAPAKGVRGTSGVLGGTKSVYMKKRVERVLLLCYDNCGAKIILGKALSTFEFILPYGT